VGARDAADDAGAARVLEAFYARARPGGPGWRAVRARVGLEPTSALGRDFAEAGAMLAMVLGAMLAIGGVVIGSTAWALGASAALVAGGPRGGS